MWGLRAECADHGSSWRRGPCGGRCALSLLLIVLTIAFHLVKRYDWYLGHNFQPWRMQTVEALGVLGRRCWAP